MEKNRIVKDEQYRYGGYIRGVEGKDYLKRKPQMRDFGNQHFHFGNTTFDYSMAHGTSCCTSSPKATF